MDQRNIPWKAEWKAAGLEPGPLTETEASLVEGLQKENQEFLRKHPFPAKLRVPTVSFPFNPAFWSVPVAAAAALIIVLGLPAPTGDQNGTFLERLKGDDKPVLLVYRQGKAGAEKLNLGAPVRPGDLLQAAYKVSKATQGALLSLDGGGNVTVHLAQEGRSVSLLPGGEHRLEFSYELDRAPQYEAFFLFTSDRAFDLEPLRQTLKNAKSWRDLPPLTFGPQIQFTVLALNKVAAP